LIKLNKKKKEYIKFPYKLPSDLDYDSQIPSVILRERDIKGEET